MTSEERKEVTIGIKDNSSAIIASFEAKKEKELVTLIANIIVTKTLKNAAEKGYSVSPLQS